MVLCNNNTIVFDHTLQIKSIGKWKCKESFVARGRHVKSITGLHKPKLIDNCQTFRQPCGCLHQWRYKTEGDSLYIGYNAWEKVLNATHSPQFITPCFLVRYHFCTLHIAWSQHPNIPAPLSLSITCHLACCHSHPHLAPFFMHCSLYKASHLKVLYCH